MPTATDKLSIIEAIEDESLFRGFLGQDLSSWQPWLVALKAVYGHPIMRFTDRDLVRQCTGRDPDSLPDEGFATSLFLTGRRSGKSRIAAVVGAFEAALAGHEHKLAKGETGIVAVIAPTRWQAGIVTKYTRAIFQTPMLEAEIVGDTRDGFKLSNGIEIAILAGDWRTVRGPTLVAAVVDEVCFFGLDEESKVRSDTELVRALKPALATTHGKLICISSPYARRGWAFAQHKRHFGNEAGTTLVWNCPSRTMNATLDQAVVDEAMAEDLQAAKSEYLGEFRDDVAIFLPREVIEGLVVKGRKELAPMPAPKQGRPLYYYAFVDISGGRGDDAAVAVAHREGDNTVIDLQRRYRPPFSPQEVIARMAGELRRYRVRRVTGDNYSGEFCAHAFAANGIAYVKCDKPKSVLYAELLPRLCSGQVELLDDDATVNQLAALERRTRSGGKDIIDHAHGAHDDLANVVAGVVRVGHRTITLGAPMRRNDPDGTGWHVGIRRL